MAFSKCAFTTISSFVSFNTSSGFVKINDDQNFIKKESVTHRSFTNDFLYLLRKKSLLMPPLHHPSLTVLQAGQSGGHSSTFSKLAWQLVLPHHDFLSSMKIIMITRLWNLLGLFEYLLYWTCSKVSQDLLFKW